MSVSDQKIEPKVAWAIKARRHLALQKKELLDEAIAEAQGQTEIVTFFQAFAEKNLSEVIRLGDQLIPKLQEPERHEKALTINLLYLHPRTDLAQSYVRFPLEDQKQMRELGIESCQQAIQIAQILNDKPCQAFYSTILGTGFAKSRQLREAEIFYTYALQIRRELAEQEPKFFNEAVARTLNNLANTQKNMRKLAEAEKSFAEALQLYRDLALQEPQIFNQYVATTLNGLGNVQDNLRKLAEAENSYAEALQLYQDLTLQEPHIFHQYVATVLNNLGGLQGKMRKLGYAEKSFAEALQIRRELAGQEPGIFNQDVATTLNNLGTVQRNLRKLKGAERSFTEALQLYQNLAGQEPHIFNQDVAMTLDGLGAVQSDMRKLAEAEKSFSEALKIRRDLAAQEPDIFNQHVAMTLDGLGTVQKNMRKFVEAETSYSEALKIRRELAAQDPQIFNQDVAGALNNLGTVQKNMRKLAEAEKSLVEALQIYRELAAQDPHIFNQDVAMMLHNLGNVQIKMRKLAEAEKSFAEALQMYQDLALQEPEIFNQNVAMTLNGLGTVQREMQKLAGAEKSYAEALQMYRGLALQEPHIFNQSVGETLDGLGTVQSDMRKLVEAEKSFIEALQIRRDLALQESHIFNQDVAETVNNLGTVQIKMRKLAEAEKSFAEALQMYRDLVLQESDIFNQDVAMTLNNLGLLRRDLWKMGDAEKSFIEALQLFRALASQEPDIFNQYLALTLNNFGNLQIGQDKLEKAKDTLESARNLIEDLRAKAITIDDRHRISQAVSPIYNNLLDCYIRMKDWKKALEIAELGKSRSLSDLLNLKSEDLQPKASTTDTLAIVKDLGQKYSDAIKELQQIESYERYLSEQLNRFENDIRRIKDEDENDDDTRQASLRQIAEQKQPLEQEKQKAQNQRFAKQDELKSVLEEIGKYDKDFPPKAKDIDVESIFAISEKQNRTIVMFRILRESTAVIFVFPTGELHIKEIKGFGQNEMFDLFRDNWLIPYLQWKNEEIGIGNWKAAIEQTLDTVYEKLMIHVRQVLKEKSDSKEVLFVPNQSLALLPLHAASWKDETGRKHYLLEEYSISYAPSVSVFKRCQENENQRSNKTLFVTNPNGCDTEKHKKSFACADKKYHLDSSEKEVEFIERLHQPSKNLLGKDAIKSTVIEALREDYGFTHFSCHGFYNQASPFDSGLVMSDEVIKLSEIINSNLQNNWLTTLSACETGMVDFASPTDEHFGLPLGFIFAGSPSVWASLWSVSDMATSELMQMAYKNLSQEEYKNNKPEALRQAQLDMIKEYPHPFFWAGFQHFGV